MEGKDFHIGDFEHGILPATAPLAISSLTVAGLAMAFARERSGRVAVSFIGEGGTSLGEWHEAINLCAARKLPAVFCIQNNQTALSTPVAEQSAVRVFADKAVGYGIPGVTGTRSAFANFSTACTCATSAGRTITSGAVPRISVRSRAASASFAGSVITRSAPTRAARREASSAGVMRPSINPALQAVPAPGR